MRALKIFFTDIHRHRGLCAVFAAGLLAADVSFAQTSVYWDLNGVTAGASVTPTGAWNTAGAANWNAASDGTGALANWTQSNHAVFSAGTDATGTYTVTLGAPITVGNLTFQTGTPTITANTLTIAAAGSTIDVASGVTARIDSLMAGTGVITKTGLGTFITGSTTSNSHTGAVNVNAGVFQSQKQAAVGAIGDAAAVSVLAGATLRFNGNATYVSETIGSLTGGGNVEHSGAAAPFALKINGAASTIFSGIISDGANNLNLEKNTGAGTLTLSGANAYDGTTTINVGAIKIQNATALGSTTSGTTVASGATLQIEGGIAVGAEALTLSGTGLGSSGAVQNITGTNSFAGNLTLAANSEIQSDAGTLTFSGTINGSAASRTLTFDGAGNTTATNVIGANISTLTKNGTGTLTLSGANTYTGATAIKAGILSINSLANVSAGASALGAPTTVANGTIAIGSTTTGATLAYTGSGHTSNRVINLAGTTGGATLDASGSGALVFSSALTATGAGSKTLTLAGSSTAANTLSGAIVNNSGTNLTSLVKSGAGTWVLSGANTFTGTTAINGGTLRLNADNRLGTAPGAATPNKLTFDGGTLETTATFTLNANRGTTINAGGGTFDVNAGTTLTYNGILAGAGTLNKTDTGTLIIGGATTNTHTGDVNVNGGILRVDKTVANKAIGDSANVTVGSGATINFNGGVSETIGALAGAGIVDNLNASAITLTTGGNNGSSDFSGVLQDTGGNLSLVKSGSGTFTLSGAAANTFAGGFQVNDGTILLNKTAGFNATGSGSSVTVGDNINVAGTAILKLSQSNQIPDTATITVNSDGKFDLNGLTETIGVIAGTGNIETGSGTLNIFGANSVSAFAGTLTGTAVDINGINGGRVILDAGIGSLTFNSNINFAGTFELKSGTLFLPGVNFTVGTLHITGNTILDFGNSAASFLDAANIKIDGVASLTINNWINNVDFFFAQNWLAGTTVPTLGQRGVGDETQITFSGFSSSQTAWLDYNSGAKHQITPVPEPSTYGAILVALAGALAFWRRQRFVRA